METTSIVLGVVLGLIAVACGVYVSFAARCKGPILSNPWIWFTKEERARELAKVDIKAEYRQPAIVFGGLALLFGYASAHSFSSFELPLYPVYIIIGLVVVYAIGSSVKSVV